ncbi:MAG TPA: winged helix-turn-helix domain-containing protein [Acidimicrobiia bacterium]|nr:winged helix-turn-helix domain-containing protein [Acidimicrobiia bacterium]
MTVTGPRVRDFTDSQPALEVEIVASSAAELVTSLFALGSEADPSIDAADAERRGLWADGVRDGASDELRSLIDRYVTGSGWAWLALIGIACESGPSVDGFLEALAAADPMEARRDLLCMMWCKGPVDREQIDRVAAGDTELLAEIDDGASKPLPPNIRGLLELEPEATVAVMVDLLRRFDTEVFHGGRDVASILERDAAAKRAMSGSMDASALVEAATDGVTFSLQPNMRGIVLVPSVVIRPWVAITDHDGLRVFVYPVAEEHLEADPDAPPSHLVDVYKALGDERRLRLLRLLVDGPTSLRDLTERLDLAKSTVHHHLRVLRKAGLVRVTIGDDNEYSMRTDAVSEAARMLDSFLNG